MKKLSCNEAIARGAYEAGVHLRQRTPSTEILENLAAYEEIEAQWSTNEKVALEVGIGAALAGARVLVAMKHVGLNVAADPLMTFSYLGVNGGFLLVTADDPGMHSSQNEQDSRQYARFAKLPMLEPSDSQEAKDFVQEALRVSEEFDTGAVKEQYAHFPCPVLVEVGSGERLVFVLTAKMRKRVAMPANSADGMWWWKKTSAAAVGMRKRRLNRLEWRRRECVICAGVSTSRCGKHYRRLQS